jgi:hypothetical protein
MFGERRHASRLMLWRRHALCLVFSFAAWAVARAQILQPGVAQARSSSGQFVIQSLPLPAPSREVAELETRTNFVRLDPTLLPVSIERIRELLWSELGARPTWSGKIFVKLYPATSAEDPITIGSEQFRDRWQYGVALPNVVERYRYVRALVGVLLLEAANRNAVAHTAELPMWLVEGLSAQLFATSEIEIILPPPTVSRTGLKTSAVYVNDRRKDPLTRAHGDLCSGRPLNFQELSWPSDDQLSGAAGKVYRSSAQFFVSELLSLPDGRASLREMLAILPQYYNWQFAFLRAFRTDFQRPLDIEKWWSLHLAHFTGRELAQTWSNQESWQKLDEIIRSAVEVRMDTNDLPMHLQAPLQTMLREWDPARQVQAMQAKLRELQAARLRLAPEFIPLADEYCRTLEAYLQNHEQNSSGQFLRKNSLLQHSRAETIQHLDELDARRSLLKPAQASNPIAQAAPR